MEQSRMDTRSHTLKSVILREKCHPERSEGSPARTIWTEGIHIMPDQNGQKKDRRWLWLAFIVIVPLLAIAIGVYSGFQYVNRPAPAKTLAAFCNAMRSGDTVMAYGQFSNAYQHAYPRQQFASDMAVDKV